MKKREIPLFRSCASATQNYHKQECTKHTNTLSKTNCPALNMQMLTRWRSETETASEEKLANRTLSAHTVTLRPLACTQWHVCHSLMSLQTLCTPVCDKFVWLLQKYTAKHDFHLLFHPSIFMLENCFRWTYFQSSFDWPGFLNISREEDTDFTSSYSVETKVRLYFRQ